MRFEVQVVVRVLHGGWALARLAADPDTCAFGATVEDAMLDLSLLLGDRIERLHPGQLHRYAASDNLTEERWLLEHALPVWREGVRALQPMKVAALRSKHKRHHRLWFPRWDLRAWIAVDQELQRDGLALLTQHLPALSTTARLDRVIEREERLEMLAIEATPAPLAAFTGKHRGVGLLPEPVEVDDDSDDRKQRKKIPTPNLDSIGIDLTHRAREGELPRAIGLDALVDRLQAELVGGAARVLIGPPGVGKTSAVQELAHRLASGPRALWAADATKLIAAKSIWSDWRSQTLGVIDEVRRTDAVWYLGELLPHLDAGKSISSTEHTAQLLRPELARGRITVIGECTPDDWARLELRDPGFARAFVPVRMEEPDDDTSVAILRGVAEARGAKKPSVAVTDAAIHGTRELAGRFGGHTSAHAQALSLLARTIDGARADRVDHPLGRNDVVATFCRETGMPEPLIRDDVSLDLDAVRGRLEARVVGQPDALARLVDLVGVIKAGLADPSKPLGSFLFVGPTGVGKTETAKALADLLYGGDDRLIRFDMAEMSTPDAVSRFLGFGGRPGKLVSEIRAAPFSVLLLDEIEKAHPSAFDALLAVLGEARLTDEAGRTASFRNTVVVMTSNLGVDTMRAAVGFGDAAGLSWREHFERAARRFFRPELFNRIDHVVAFRALPAAALRGITDRELEKLGRREGLRTRGLVLEVPEDVRDWLTARGVDPKLGARPLKRCLERELALPIAARLESTSTAPGAIRVALEDDALVIAHVPAKGTDRGAAARRAAVDAIGELRYFVEAAWQDRALRTLALDVSRMERLLSNPRYLAGHDELAERYRSAGEDRALYDEAAAFRERVASLEELAFEAAFQRDDDAIAQLEGEREGAIEALGELALRLAGRTIDEADEVILTVRAKPDALVVFRDVVYAWAAIAERRAWRARGYLAAERPPREPTAESPPTVYAFDGIGDADPDFDQLKRLVGGALSELSEQEIVFAIRFDGRHAGTLLRHEVGAHVRHDVGETKRVAVGHATRAEIDAEHDREAWASILGRGATEIARTIHYQKKVVRDHALDEHVAYTPRLGAIYERFQIERVWNAVFFDRAHRAFRGQL